jgi:hypothetical protein
MKKKTDELIASQRNGRNLNSPQNEETHLKNQLLSKKTFNERTDSGSPSAETKEIKVTGKTKSKYPVGSTRYSMDKATGSGKPRFSVMNKKSKMSEKSQNKSEVENEFRIFYQQNYSNTG